MLNFSTVFTKVPGFPGAHLAKEKSVLSSQTKESPPIQSIKKFIQKISLVFCSNILGHHPK
jgi:hypothetical protein